MNVQPIVQLNRRKRLLRAGGRGMGFGGAGEAEFAPHDHILLHPVARAPAAR